VKRRVTVLSHWFRKLQVRKVTSAVRGDDPQRWMLLANVLRNSGACERIGQAQEMAWRSTGEFSNALSQRCLERFFSAIN
jgi:hypothetical protein